MRYASLHRQIEKGMASNETWTQLVRVCIELGLQDEARGAFRNVHGSSERFRLQNLLVRHGIVVHPDRELQKLHEAETRHDTLDDVGEAVHFLSHDHMPLTLIVATAIFPLVVGLSGYLTAGSASLLLSGIALVPALLVLMAVGALARRVFVEASRGFEDVPELPPPGRLGHEVARFAADAVLTVGILLAPAAVLYAAATPPEAFWAALLVGALLLPMGLMLRVLRDDWQALSPPVLLRAVWRGGPDYLARLAAVCVLFSPAVALGFAAGSHALYLQLALIGPLLVVPLLISARMLGRFLHDRRSAFRDLLGLRRVSGQAAPAVHEARRVDRPEPQAPADGRLRGPRPDRQRAPRPVPAAVPQPVPVMTRTRRATPPAEHSMWEGEPCPDLLSLPGVTILTGADRDRAGAASSARQ